MMFKQVLFNDFDLMLLSCKCPTFKINSRYFGSDYKKYEGLTQVHSDTQLRVKKVEIISKIKGQI